MKQSDFSNDRIEKLWSSAWQVRLLSLFFVLLSAVGISGCSSAEDEALAAGAKTYQQVCKVCHAQGINGAPILGNKKMWRKRAPQGLEVLVEHAMNGYGLMPAKGGKAELTKQEISNTVKYMLSQLEEN